MTIEFPCSSCSSTLRVPKEHLGKQARCPKCKNLNEVKPAAALDSASPAFGAAPTQNYAAPNPPVENMFAPGAGSSYPHGGASAGYRQPHRGGMILAFGIVALVCNIAAVPGILAWVMGKNDLRAMDSGHMDPMGRGNTQAGMIMGMVMTILFLIGIAFTVCYLLFMFILFAGVAGAAAGGM